MRYSFLQCGNVEEGTMKIAVMGVGSLCKNSKIGRARSKTFSNFPIRAQIILAVSLELPLKRIVFYRFLPDGRFYTG